MHNGYQIVHVQGFFPTGRTDVKRDEQVSGARLLSLPEKCFLNNSITETKSKLCFSCTYLGHTPLYLNETLQFQGKKYIHSSNTKRKEGKKTKPKL